MSKTEFKQTKKDGLNIVYHVKIPKALIDSEIDTKLKEIAPKANITGFRPGKVPLSVLKIKYKDSLRSEVLNKLINTTNEKVLSDNKINPLTYPDINFLKNNHDSDLEYELLIEEMPEIALKDLSKVSVTRKIVSVEDQQIKDTLGKLAASNAETKPIITPRKTKKDDLIVMDFVGKIDNQPFKGGSGEKFQYKLGSERIIPDLEKGLIGIDVPFSGDIPVTFPKDYQETSLAGKKAVFSVKVNQHLEEYAPKVDDKFAQKFGLKDLSELKKNVVESLKVEYSKISDQLLKQEVFDKLDKEFSFELPKNMLNKEVETIKEMREKQPLDEADAKLSAKELEKKYSDLAIRRVKLVCIISKIVSENKFTVDNEQLNLAISNEAKSFRGREKEVFDYYQKNPEAKSRLTMQLLEGQALDWLQSKIKTEEKTVSYDELNKELSPSEQLTKQ